MARKDWASIGIPVGLADRLDEFLESTEAKRMGVTSRQQVLTLLVRDLLEKWDIERKKKK